MDGQMLAIRLPARFLSVGQCVARDGWVHPDRTLDSSVLIVVERGRFGLAVGGERHVLGPGMALLLPEGVRHAGFCLEGGDAPTYYWAHFEGGAGGESAVRLPAAPVALSDLAFNRLATRFHHLINESSVDQGHSLLCDYMISVLLLELQREGRETPCAAVANRMLEYVRLHCYERLTLCDLSRALGYSEDYLSRLFHEQVACSFRQYIHRLRMQRATKELLGSVKTIQQIAAECGYNNAKFFSTAFMKYEGISPSAYRNMYGGLHQNNA